MPFFGKGEKMKYIIIGIVAVVLLAIILVYPFKITIYNDENYLFINISKLVDLKLNLFVFLNDRNAINKDKSKKGMKLIKKIKFKEIDFKLQGLNFDYRINGAYFGILYGIFGFLDSVCKINDRDLNYDLRYSGDKSIEFKSVVRARITNLLRVFQGI